MAKKKTQVRRWMLPSPSQRTAKAPLAERIKADVDAKATKLVERLKPKYVQPPPKEPRFNYIIDVWTKWIGGTLYFGADLRLPRPQCDLALVRGQVRPHGTFGRRPLRPVLHAAYGEMVQVVS